MELLMCEDISVLQVPATAGWMLLICTTG